MRWFLAIALLSSGCVFKVRSVDGAVGGDDFGADDMAVGGDDLGDMAVADDLLPPPDLTPQVLMLSHVPQHYLTDGTCDLVVTTSIDTSARKVDGNDVPAGCVFTNETETGPPAVDVTVLAVHSIVFNGTVKVSGTRGLVVVAGTTIQVNGTLDGSAVKAAAGPGGAAATMGMGAGPSGKHAMGGMTFSDSGGSGGSYGTVGGNGGPGSFNPPGDTAASPGTSMAYGSPNLTMSAPGGSGGGTGSSEACNGKNGGPGGAGGGSIQLSAGTSITVGASGSINVGGGGGGGGCEPATTDEGSGGGGGSGGAVFLESPSVNVSGGLWANGGSGGGGASGDALGHEGKDGNDATTSQTGATGGPAGAGGFGGNGGDGYPPATATSSNGAGSANGGGGGGGAGRIVVRSRGAATIVMTKISPPPALDPNIP